MQLPHYLLRKFKCKVEETTQVQSPLRRVGNLLKSAASPDLVVSGITAKPMTQRAFKAMLLLWMYHTTMSVCLAMSLLQHGKRLTLKWAP